MSEPKIDEMLAWVDMVWVEGDAPIAEAIRAILEQHRLSADEIERDWHVRELEAVRAFVERVEKKMPQFLEGKPLTSAVYAMRLERDALEKESGADEHVTK